MILICLITTSLIIHLIAEKKDVGYADKRYQMDINLGRASRARRINERESVESITDIDYDECARLPTNADIIMCYPSTEGKPRFMIAIRLDSISSTHYTY